MPSRNRHREKTRTSSAAPEQQPLAPTITRLDTPDDLPAFVAEVTDPERHHPVVVVSCASDTNAPRLDVAALARTLPETTRVYVHGNHELAWVANRLLPKYLACFGGACRLIRPNPTAGDPSHLHPIFVTREHDDPGRTIRMIASEATRTVTAPPRTHLRAVHTALDRGPETQIHPSQMHPAGRSATGPARPGLSAVPPLPPTPSSPVPVSVAGLTEEQVIDLQERLARAESEQARLAADRADLQDRLARAERQRVQLTRTNADLSSELTGTRQQHVAARAALTRAEQQVASLTERLAEPEEIRAEMQARLQDLIDERDQLREDLAAMTRQRNWSDDELARVREVAARAERAETALNAARKKVRALTDQVDDLTERLHGWGVFADPAEQFRHEVTTAWLAAIPEAQRDELALRPYEFGPDFLTSVDGLHGVKRDRIVAAVVDVLTGVVWTSNGRKPHQYRTGASGGNDYVVREDGAALWRCAVQRNTASARRLMWWERTDGIVELASVAIHDDFTVPR